MLGALQHASIRGELEADLAALPDRADEAARRVVEGLRTEFDQLREREDARPYTHYALVFEPDGSRGAAPVGLPSRLAYETPPAAVLAWFSLDAMPYIGMSAEPSAAGDARLDFLSAEHAPPAGREATREFVAELRDACETIVLRRLGEPELDRHQRLVGREERRASTAAVLRQWSQVRGRPPAERAQVEDLFVDHHAALARTPAEYSLVSFRPTAYRDDEDRLRLVLLRRVLVHSLGEEALERVPELRFLPMGPSLVQGVLLDADWLFGEALERAAARSLGRGEALAVGDAPAGTDGASEKLDLLGALGFEGGSDVDPELGAVTVTVDAGRARARHQRRLGGFWALAGVIVLLLATGMGLLLQNVRRELERAERLRDFAAAVTHELRTPVSTIRLHAELLVEGWTTEPGRRREYYRRIADSAERLGELVERVLESSRLSSGTTRTGPSFETEPGDLSAAVAALRPSLVAGGADDLALELADDLPPVGLAREPLAGIVLNLVQNARRYAAPGPGGEPILVRTARAAEGVVLEVADRGPGVPESERERVFQPFRRSTDGRAERAPGAGLGLYLVDLYARALGGRAECLARPGGGALFRVVLPPARRRRLASRSGTGSRPLPRRDEG